MSKGSVRVVAIAAMSALLLASTAVAQQPAPPPPQNVKASNVTSTSLVLSWSSVPSASSYDVYAGSYQSNTSATSFTFTGLTPCTTYTVGVRSHKTKAVSAWVTLSATTTGCGTPPPPPSNTALPTITGTLQQGSTVKALPGTWTNSPTNYSYRWQDCTATATGSSCSDITGAGSGNTYTLQSADVGKKLDVIVTALNSGGSSSATSLQTATVIAAPPPAAGLHVVGHQLQDASNQPVFLHGVNRAGTEYSCIHNTGFFDGTGTNFTQEDAQITSMAAWHINGEMITLNEDCWLGINGVPAAYSNSSTSPPTPGCSATQCPYANAIENLVKTDEANHIYPVISLMFLAPGTTQSTSHNTLADNDHAPLFWEEVADFFKNDPNVAFRLEQEPTLGYGSESDWQCWAQGDVSYSTSSVNTPPTAPTSTGSPNKCSGAGLSSYKTVGMQSLVNIVRGTGSTNVIALPGLGYSNMLACGPSTAPSSCGMLASATPPVTDAISPAQLIASVDVYPEGNTCGDQLNTSCYDATYKPVAAVMPLIAGETGENPNNIYTPTTYVDMFMSWMDANGNGYFPYAWDPWAQLIAGYTSNSTPTTVWGTDYYDHINGIS